MKESESVDVTFGDIILYYIPVQVRLRTKVLRTTQSGFELMTSRS